MVGKARSFAEVRFMGCSFASALLVYVVYFECTEGKCFKFTRITVVPICFGKVSKDETIEQRFKNFQDLIGHLEELEEHRYSDLNCFKCPSH